MAAKPKFKWSVTVDVRELSYYARKEAKLFGETLRDATSRLGLQTARELAKSTEPFGRSWQKTMKIQRGAIITDMNKVFTQDKNAKINTVEDAERIMDRKRRALQGARPKDEGGATRITPEAFTGLLMLKFRRALMAKAAWIGSARHLERKQGKGFQIRLGKAYTPYLKRWEKLGTGTDPSGDWRPSLTLENNVWHIQKEYVLKKRAINKDQYYAIVKTIQWYERAATKNLAKNKP